jgi:hypothetical protein
MKLHTENQNFDGMVPDKRIPFKISPNAKLFGILSDGIYKDKILAVIRELSCNASDAHIVAKRTTPFKVFVPNALDPTFAIIDEGTGIDPEKIADIFWTYGESTKTQTNDLTGALGLGSKSPFAYTKSSFIVKNRYKGIEHTYFCFINESGIPDGSEIDVSESKDPDGITVELAVRQEDINAFKKRLSTFFAYWPQDRRPTFVNSDFSIEEHTKLYIGSNWYIHTNEDRVVKAQAVMGCVPYPIDIAAVPNPSKALKFIANNGFVIEFPLGTLSFQASREELSYERVTVDALEAMADRVTKELFKQLHDQLVSDTTTYFDTFCRYELFKRTLKSLSWAAYYTDDGSITKESDIVKKIIFDGSCEIEVGGKKINLSTFDNTNLILTTKHHSSCSVMKANGYSANGKPSLKQAREVCMTKQHYVLPSAYTKEVVDALVATGVDISSKMVPGSIENISFSWFKPSLKPVAPKSIGNRTPATALYDGFTVSGTRLIISANSIALTDIRNNTFQSYIEKRKTSKEVFTNAVIVVNDMGSNGSYYFKHYALQKRLDQSSFLFIEQDKSLATPDFGMIEIKDLLKETVLDGIRVEYLSKLPEFTIPKEEVEDKVKVPRTKHPKGSIEVRSVIFTAHKTVHYSNDVDVFGITVRPYPLDRASEYRRIQSSEFNGLYYIAGDKVATQLLTREAIEWLYSVGLFKEFFNANGELIVISRNEASAQELINKGAKLTELTDYVKAKLAASDLANVVAKNSIASELKLAGGLTNFTKAQILPHIINKLSGSSMFRQYMQELYDIHQTIAAQEEAIKAERLRVSRQLPKVMGNVFTLELDNIRRQPLWMMQEALYKAFTVSRELRLCLPDISSKIKHLEVEVSERIADLHTKYALLHGINNIINNYPTYSRHHSTTIYKAAIIDQVATYINAVDAADVAINISSKPVSDQLDIDFTVDVNAAQNTAQQFAQVI